MTGRLSWQRSALAQPRAPRRVCRYEAPGARGCCERQQGAGRQSVHEVVVGGFQADGGTAGGKHGVRRRARATHLRSTLSLMRSNDVANPTMYLESLNRIKSELKSCPEKGDYIKLLRYIP